jgi:Zn ribbon nucleic-acid-binding protein
LAKTIRKIDIKEFKCPFCETKVALRISEDEIEEETGKVIAGVGIDYWNCPKCGEENDIGLEVFEEDYIPFREFTDKDDWEGLLNFCKNNEFDDFFLYSLGKLYIQEQKFEKALNIGKILVSLDPRDIVAQNDLIDRGLKGIKLLRQSVRR